MIDFDAFAARARALAAEMPAEFMAGIETVEVLRDAKAHPHVPGVFTLGECATSHLSDPTGQEPFRSVIRLFYGSFAELAQENETFDVMEELEETLEHEVRHHLEDRAGEKALRDEDALFEAHARFRVGLEVPVGWYRHGEQLEEGLWAVDLDLFLELDLRRADWEGIPGTRLSLRILDEDFEVDVPADARPDEIWTFEDEGLVEAEEDEEEVVVEDLADDEPPGLCGALHVIPVVH